MDLSLKVHTTIQPVFVKRKIEQELKGSEGNKATNFKSAVLFIVFNVTCVMRVM